MSAMGDAVSAVGLTREGYDLWVGETYRDSTVSTMALTAPREGKLLVATRESLRHYQLTGFLAARIAIVAGVLMSVIGLIWRLIGLD